MISQVIFLASVYESEVAVVDVGEEREDVVGGFGDLRIVTVKGEDRIARCAASAESRMARIGRSS